MTLLIKNVRLLGSQLPPEGKADVFVSGGSISAIGDFPHKGADEVIDGQGGYLAPGFIDVDTTSDHYLGLFDDPGQEDFLRQGVTTIIGGHCGASLAPLLYGTLESIRKWADTDRLNVDWHTVGEFMARLAEQRLGVNFATFAGHATIRRAILGEDVRDLTKNELAVFSSVLQRALAEGAVGLSTGLEYVHARGTSYQELLALAKIVRAGAGIYSTHLRSTTEGIAEAMKETIKLASESGASTLVSHFMPYLGFEEEYRRAVGSLESAGPNIDLHVDMHPWGGSMLPFYRLLPKWAQSGTLEIMAKGVKDSWMAKRIVKELPEFQPEDLVIAEAHEQNILVGESLGSFMQKYEMSDPRQALLRLLALTGLQGVAYVQNIDRPVADRMLAHPRTLIASHAPALSRRPHEKLFKSPRATDTFPEYLRRVTSKNLLSLKDAVAKVTSVPADKFKLERRGRIKEGNIADLVVFKDFAIKTVIINGTVAVREAASTGARAGRPLLHRPS